MNKILIATKNKHKVYEFDLMLKPLGYEVISLLDIDFDEEIIENGNTFEQNALIKARYISEKYNMDVISDDSGICISHLNGDPGVKSARWLGEDTSYDIKNNEVLKLLEDATDRSAYYVCAIAYVRKDGSSNVFKGFCKGEIAKEASGSNGFGYDPIFYYDKFKTTIANISDEDKNTISHRKMALDKFVAYLQNKSKQVHLVLYEPEIPQNTGNMMRTCSATDTVLHLIEPLGFKLDEKGIKRAGMDYAYYLTMITYKNYEEFKKYNSHGECYYLTRYAQKAPSDFNFKSECKDVYVMLGKESTGIDKKILYDNYDNCLRLPMVPYARSLNISNCASVIIYEVLRQLDYNDLSFEENIKGKDYIKSLFSKDN